MHITMVLESLIYKVSSHHDSERCIMPIDLVVSTPCVITYRDTMYTLLDISL